MRFKFNRWLGSLLLIAACLSVPVLETGCKHTFQSGGVYSESGSTNGTGNNGLYNTDLSIRAAHDVIHTFVSFEYNNRALVQKQFPEVTAYADKLRAQAPQWEKSAVATRDAYAANPTSANKSAFDTAMSVLDEAVAQAQQYLSKTVKTR